MKLTVFLPIDDTFWPRIQNLPNQSKPSAPTRTARQLDIFFPMIIYPVFILLPSFKFFLIVSKTRRWFITVDSALSTIFITSYPNKCRDWIIYYCHFVYIILKPIWYEIVITPQQPINDINNIDIAFYYVCYSLPVSLFYLI